MPIFHLICAEQCHTIRLFYYYGLGNSILWRTFYYERCPQSRTLKKTDVLFRAVSDSNYDVFVSQNICLARRLGVHSERIK